MVPVRSLVFSGSTHLASSTASELRLKPLETGQIVLVRNSAESFGLSPAFSPNGQVLGIGGHGPRRSWLLDAEKGAELEPLEVGPEGARSIAFSPDGTTLAVASGKSSAVTLWDWPGRRQLGVSCTGAGASVNLLCFLTRRVQAARRRFRVGSQPLGCRFQEEKRLRRRSHHAGITAPVSRQDGHLFVTAGATLDHAVRFSGFGQAESPGDLCRVSSRK